jgi:hypothetical protein
MYASLSYTLSKATNTTEPDGNGIGPNEAIMSRLGEVDEDRASSINVIARSSPFTYKLPYNFSAGNLTQLASARPFNATTGVDNNGDGANNDRPVINGHVIAKSAFRGTATSEVAIFVENRISLTERMKLLLRLEGFNIFNHGNYLGRGVTTYGNNATPDPTFGQFVGNVGTTTNAYPGVRKHRPTANVPTTSTVHLLSEALVGVTLRCRPFVRIRQEMNR